MTQRRLTRSDILPMDVYGAERRERRKGLIALKATRRLEIGPFAVMHFECFETMWAQVHEMLYVEKGGEAQIEGELAAYNSLIPDGHELVATLMFEIEDPARRHRLLSAMGGVERTVTLSFADQVIRAVPEEDVDRTTADGKTSSVHFLHFPFTPDLIKTFQAPEAVVTAGIGHANYGHLAILSETVRNALAKDFL